MQAVLWKSSWLAFVGLTFMLLLFAEITRSDPASDGESTTNRGLHLIIFLVDSLAEDSLEEPPSHSNLVGRRAANLGLAKAPSVGFVASAAFVPGMPSC